MDALVSSRWRSQNTKQEPGTMSDAGRTTDESTGPIEFSTTCDLTRQNASEDRLCSH